MRPTAAIVLIPLAALAQSRTNVPVTHLNSKVMFIQPAGKRADVFLRHSSGQSWKLWQVIPTNYVREDQAVCLQVTNAVRGTEARVEFKP